MRKLLAVMSAAALAGVLGQAVRGDDKLPAIQKVEIKGDHFEVNGAPFFPIMSWAQISKSYEALHQLGITVHAGSANAGDAAKVGDYVVADFGRAGANRGAILAWIHGDEPDMADKKKTPPGPRSTPEVLVEKYQQIKKDDATRPVFVTFTAGFMKAEKDYPADARAKLYPAYMNAADAVGFDIYPIYGSGFPTHLNYVGDGVAELKAIAGPHRPVYAWIETSKGSQWMTYEKQPDVLPMHTRNEVWQAIINGATAIGYFTHAWKPAFKEFAPTEEMQTEMKRLDAQITRLTPAILGAPVQAKITMKLGDDLLCQFKATESDGFTYIFALNKDLGPAGQKTGQFDPIKPRAGKATFTVTGLKAGTVVEVVDEKRTIPADGGSFTDDFQPLAEHIYKIKL